jgi:hypothetical protein
VGGGLRRRRRDALRAPLRSSVRSSRFPLLLRTQAYCASRTRQASRLLAGKPPAGQRCHALCSTAARGFLNSVSSAFRLPIGLPANRGLACRRLACHQRMRWPAHSQSLVRADRPFRGPRSQLGNPFAHDDRQRPCRLDLLQDVGSAHRLVLRVSAVNG